MAVTENLYSLNIRDYLKSRDSHKRELLSGFISSYTCTPNPDIEHFLKHNAIEFTKKQHLAFTRGESPLFVGYFALAVKPFKVGVNDIPSNTWRRKIERVARFNEEKQIYSAAGYLIAQLGKNYTDGMNELITGSELLRLALNVVLDIQDMAGGMIAFLDAENNNSLIDFYTKSGFHLISDPNSPREELIQFYRMI